MSLKRQTAWSMAPLVVITALNLISVPWFLRYLGTEMYALWFYVITLSNLFGFADLGLGVAVSRFIGVALGRGDQQAVREYWSTGNMLVLPVVTLMAVAFCGLGVIFGPHWFQVSPENVGLLRACFLAGGLSLFFNYYAQLWVTLLQAHLNFRFLGALRIGMCVFQIVPALYLARRTGTPLAMSVWGAMAGFVNWIILWGYARRHYGMGIGFQDARRSRLAEMVGYSVKMLLSLVTGALLGTVDRVLLGRLAPAAQFTHYNIAGNVGMRLQSLGVAVMGPVFHNTNRALGEGGARTPASIFDEMFRFTLDAYLLAVIWLAVWHPLALRLWLGAETAGHVAPLLMPLVLVYSFNAVAGISNTQLCSLNRVGTAIGFQVAAGLLAVLGVYFGWRVAGAVGAAWGFLASRMAMFAQDVFTARLVGAGGWLHPRTGMSLLLHLGAGGVFLLSRLALPSESLWAALPAAVHGALGAAWLVRQPLFRWWQRFSGQAEAQIATGTNPTEPL